MKGTRLKWMEAGAFAGLLLLGSVGAAAQSGSTQSGQSGQSAPPAQQQTDKDKANTLTLDTPAPPVNAEEDAAFKAFNARPLQDGPKKIQAAEAFIQKYPQSRYNAAVYSNLVKLYVA